MKIIKKMNPSRICIIVLLAFISAVFFKASAHGWTSIGKCYNPEFAQYLYSQTKNKYDSIDRSKLPPDVGNSLSNQWQNLTGENNILIQKFNGLSNYCAKLQSKADSTDADVSKFNSACGDKDWDLPAYSHCESWAVQIDAEIRERESERDRYKNKLEPYLDRERRFIEDLKNFTEMFYRARCDAVKEVYYSFKSSFETLENEKKLLQEKINILRKKIAETVEFPSRDYSAQDLAECESLAYQMLGVHCSIWDNSEWAQKNPILGSYKVEKYYLEVNLIKIDKEAKRLMYLWQGKYNYYRLKEKLTCPELKKSLYDMAK